MNRKHLVRVSRLLLLSPITLVLASQAEASTVIDPFDDLSQWSITQNGGNGVKADGMLRFSYRWGQVSRTVIVESPGVVRLSVMVDNSQTNRIGGGNPIPDEYQISVGEGVYVEKNAHSSKLVTVETTTTIPDQELTISISGIDRGFWAGWYGPTFDDLVIEQVPTETSTTTESIPPTTTTSTSVVPATYVETTTSVEPSTSVETSTTMVETTTSTTVETAGVLPETSVAETSTTIEASTTLVSTTVDLPPLRPVATTNTPTTVLPPMRPIATTQNIVVETTTTSMTPTITTTNTPMPSEAPGQSTVQPSTGISTIKPSKVSTTKTGIGLKPARLVSRGLRKGVSPGQQRAVVAGAVLIAMPSAFRSTGRKDR